MKPYKILFFLICLFFLQTKAQILYVDVSTPAVMTKYANDINKKQDETNTKLNGLKRAQAWVGTQMVLVNEVQNKIYNGLKEVNGTLTNGFQVKNIYQNLSEIPRHIREISKEVKEAPQFAIFANKAGQQVYQKSLEIYTDIADLLTSGELNLATSGDRQRILANIELNTNLLNIYLINIKLSIIRAKRLGFWKAINPFQNYIESDKQIFQDIIRRSKYF